jgi:hypothetical protein
MNVANTPDSKSVPPPDEKKGSGSETRSQSNSSSVSNAGVISLGDGAFLFKNILSIEEQDGIVRACNQLDTTRSNSSRTSNLEQARLAKLPLTLIAMNWMGDGKDLNIADSGGLFQFGAATYTRARNGSEPAGSNSPDQCCTFTPTALSALWYTDGSALPAHQDAVSGWVLTISVGCSAIFNYTSDTLKGKSSDGGPKVQLDSGDVLLFNCTKWTHGIEKILSGTAPAWWQKLKSDVGVSDLARFCLQFRDSSHVQPAKASS